MSDATIIRFPRKTKKGSRSGRYSTKAIYEKTDAKTKADASNAQARPPIKLLPPLTKDRPGMATDYSCRLGPRNIARIKLEEKSRDHYWIDWVFVPPSHRGSGIGAQLMNRVLADADGFGIVLSLEAKACAGPNQDKLEAWYRGMGFFPTNQTGPFGPILRRRPRSKQRRRAA